MCSPTVSVVKPGPCRPACSCAHSNRGSPEGLTIYILCTLRSLDGDPEIHAQGMHALAATNWVRQDLPVRVPVQALA